jgi:hypothetical protein
LDFVHLSHLAGYVMSCSVPCCSNPLRGKDLWTRRALPRRCLTEVRYVWPAYQESSSPPKVCLLAWSFPPKGAVTCCCGAGPVRGQNMSGNQSDWLTRAICVQDAGSRRAAAGCRSGLVGCVWLAARPLRGLAVCRCRHPTQIPPPTRRACWGRVAGPPAQTGPRKVGQTGRRNGMRPSSRPDHPVSWVGWSRVESSRVGCGDVPCRWLVGG